jgi:hypothetical protein
MVSFVKSASLPHGEVLVVVVVVVTSSSSAVQVSVNDKLDTCTVQLVSGAWCMSLWLKLSKLDCTIQQTSYSHHFRCNNHVGWWRRWSSPVYLFSTYCTMVMLMQWRNNLSCHCIPLATHIQNNQHIWLVVRFDSGEFILVTQPKLWSVM